jgi:hypothetical protein
VDFGSGILDFGFEDATTTAQCLAATRSGAGLIEDNSMSERKHALAYRSSVAAVIFLNLAIYNLGCGPFIGAASRNRIPRPVVRVGLVLYFPLHFVVEHGPAPIKETIHSYVGYWREQFARK